MWCRFLLLLLFLCSLFSDTHHQFFFLNFLLPGKSSSVLSTAVISCNFFLTTMHMLSLWFLCQSILTIQICNTIYWAFLFQPCPFSILARWNHKQKSTSVLPCKIVMRMGSALSGPNDPQATWARMVTHPRKSGQSRNWVREWLTVMLLLLYWPVGLCNYHRIFYSLSL